MIEITNDDVYREVRDAIREALRGDEILLSTVWIEQSKAENRYFAAWLSPSRDRGRNSGTHMVCISPDGKESLLVHGHYDMTPKDAIDDCHTRAGS
jgi:hypothetical protein